MKKFIINSVEGFAVQNSKLLIILLIINCSLQIANAQPGNAKRANHWFFGDGAGLDFSSGQAVADTNGAMIVGEGCATISDSLGNLQFYTNSETIWNKNHQVMDNGNGLFGCETSSQSSIIIPKPNDTNIYYVFTVDMDCGLKGLIYSIVDMSLNSGLGAVTQKNIHLLDTVFEKITAVYHKNNTDIWLMVNKGHLNKYYAYLITENGIDTTPVISSFTDSIKILHNDSIAQGYFGYMKFSPDGSKLANAVSYFLDTINWTGKYIAYINLFNFDNEIGELYNKMVLPADSIAYGLSFSPNSNLLYYTAKIELNTTDSYLFQYNLVGNINDIVNSKTLIYHHFYNLYDLGTAAIQLSPDNKIYYTKYITNYISCINKPNSVGLLCNFIDSSLYIGKQSFIGLPNFIESYFLSDTITENINIDENKHIFIYPNPANQIITIKSELNTNLIIYNIYGTKIKTMYLRETTSNIDVSNLENGIFIFSLRTKNITIIKKIIINH